MSGPVRSYVTDPYVAERRRTRVVRVGDVAIGGDNPIRIQSMTNTDTMDTRGTADQIERLAAAGCEIARVTAPSIRDAENLREIKAALDRRGVKIPLVADIHFTPNAAMIAAECVEKVRINPGNYADKKKFEVREYTDAEYAAELERVGERFRPLAIRCRENGTAMRIGTNHGSLSDRIMNRHGDSPLGMVESALEFLDVCEDARFYDIVFSMKASNTHVAIQAYRLLAARLAERAGDAPSYPFHLGVTEAGDMLDGRIKSAIGIGALLEDGIGDTIRVSLTEDPVREVPVAQRIVAHAERSVGEDREVPATFAHPPPAGDPFSYARRETARSEPPGQAAIGGEEPVRVWLEIAPGGDSLEQSAAALAASLAKHSDVACEGLCVAVDDERAVARHPALVAALRGAGVALPLAARMPLALLEAGAGLPEGADRLVVVVVPRDGVGAIEGVAAMALAGQRPLEWCLRASRAELPELVARVLGATPRALFERLAFSLETDHPGHATRLLAACLRAQDAEPVPIVLRHRRAPAADDETALVSASVDLGMPLCDGLGDAICLAGFADAGNAVDVGYRILQGARLRTTRTEYISCPSCGRTLFDLEETTARIKSLTEHLSGVKIGIMGCIVNGPGEMADADFGYVGSGPGQVTLYVGQTVVARSIPETEAPDRLIDLIREHGRWREVGDADSD
jgi:(E)-4-hydroxy-3-methylbut-2-enyl-diphosphate synthase